MSMWTRCKRYINKRQIGTVITRPEFLYYLYQGPPPKYQRYGAGDKYRRCLSILGVLEIVGRGKYKILHHIKENVTSTLVKEISYGHNWKQWFYNIRAEE